MPVQTRIQLRRDTAAYWTSTNPTLAAGEVGVETDTLKSKIGNGSTAWNSLAYAPAGLADRATSLVGGAAGSLPYQTAANTTTMLSVGTSGQVLMSTGTAPNWVTPKLNAFATTSSEELRAVISDETGTGAAVFATSPALTTPVIGSAGALFAGSTSGQVTLRATAAAGSGTLTLPSGTGTVLTAETAASTYVELAGDTMTGPLAMGTNNISGVGTLSAANVTATSISTVSTNSRGIVTNTSGGVLSAVAAVPVANGGTGGTTVKLAQEGLRIFVQQTEPSSPVANDIWLW